MAPIWGRGKVLGVWFNDVSTTLANLIYCLPACTLRMWLMLNYECSLPGLMKEIIIFMIACKLVTGNYEGLYNANI